jgi:hypothetical protein
MLALSNLTRECPLSGVKRTCPFALQMSAYDPKRTSDVSVHGCVWPTLCCMLTDKKQEKNSHQSRNFFAHPIFKVVLYHC